MKHFSSLILLLAIYINASAQPYNGKKYQPENPKAAGCAPANSSTFLQFNNVRSITHTGGNLWQEAGKNSAVYEVPKGSGKNALFASSLWLGGVDVNDQLKLAAVRYRNGNDYWPGPLTDDGTAKIIPEQCVKYDKHFVISRDKVEKFRAWYNAGIYDQVNGTNTQSENYPNYEIPKSIKNWPAHGDPSLGQDFYLAPFYDNPKGPNGANGVYNPEVDGDYPWYDLNNDINCKTDRTVTLFGDKTLWWVMNDKGNIHSETGGDPLGMEIRSQAFAFATNDEVNNMSFYNYELINRSTQTLYNTYFGVFVDVALGGAFDDYVGCDVGRGLGYSYNGDAYDGTEQGFIGYGENPPAIGVDFFEGPYQDDDGLDNQFGIGPGQAVKGNGLGYSDNIIDNERFGMRRFIYYNNIGLGNENQTDPTSAPDYYNYLRGFWKDGTKFIYGGTGHISDGDADPSLPCDFMFPGDSDPQGWGTGGIQLPAWTEVTAGNQAYDRRFAQSAGPFILRPGAVNNITVGVVYARAKSGDPFESVVKLRQADDKAQALFDNCFRVMDGPEAPNLAVQELENEVILTLSNPASSNNYAENYEEVDPFLVKPNSVSDSVFSNKYKFQGYQIFQLKNKDVSVSEIDDPAEARLVFQCDIEDGVKKLVNYEYDEQLELSIPEVKVAGNDEGIRKSVSVTEDLFASGTNRTLVNHKTYYYIAVSYAYNNYKTYNPNNSDALDGQKTPYIRSRKAPLGEITSLSAIPHTPIPENGGTFIAAEYGDEPNIKRLDGRGNGSNSLAVTQQDINKILAGDADGIVTYKSGQTPIQVKVIDPLAVRAETYEILFADSTGGNNISEDSYWYLLNKVTGEKTFSKQSISIGSEQLFPDLGISVTIENVVYPQYGSGYKKTNPIGSSITFEDSSKLWLTGTRDDDMFFPTNWILSGTQNEDCQNIGPINNPCNYNDLSSDKNQKFESILDGIAAPWYLVNHNVQYTPGGNFPYFNGSGTSNAFDKLQLNNVELIVTEDKSKWTRCPVIEMSEEQGFAEGGQGKFKLRASASVNKEGRPDNSGTEGMGWFPGYAIDVETGQRLNIVFGENSAMPNNNGHDMKWNPTAKRTNSVIRPIFGGMHFVYIFSAEEEVPAYDQGNYIYSELKTANISNYFNIFRNCMWVINPLLAENADFLSTRVTINLSLEKPYEKEIYKNSNEGLPHYEFNLNKFAPTISHAEAALKDSILNQIQAVPNPYYGYNEYERSKLDNRIKITDLPPQCTVSIYNLSGVLVRKFEKDNPLSSLDWNLKNHNRIRVSGGVYLIHVEVPEVGEKVIKWFGSMKAVDIDNF